MVPKSEHEFAEKSRLRNFPLVVQGEMLWVSRETLAELSPVFEKMFFGEFREGQEEAEEAELPDKELKDVLEFLRVVLPPVLKPISGKTENEHKFIKSLSGNNHYKK